LSFKTTNYSENGKECGDQNVVLFCLNWYYGTQVEGEWCRYLLMASRARAPPHQIITSTWPPMLFEWDESEVMGKSWSTFVRLLV
jgi:hypothetical protein